MAKPIAGQFELLARRARCSRHVHNSDRRRRSSGRRVGRGDAQRHGRMMNDHAAMPTPDVSGMRAHTQFEMAVFGPAMLSLATSQIAVDRARKADSREFAGFELADPLNN